MPELEPARLKIIGEVNGKKAIRDAKQQLAKSHGVPLSRIGHCIDGETHDELGENSGFIAMREKGKEQKLLALVRKDKGQDIVPHQYIGSLIHRGLSTEAQRRMVHIFIKIKPRTVYRI